MATNPARKRAKPVDSADSPITVIREATCPTSTGKSTLGYNVGIDDSGETHFKITSNTGGGHFTSSWIAFTDVQSALEAWPADQPVTSMALRPLSRGKSANDAGFACAVLVAEGLLVKVPGKSRVHEAIDPADFTAIVGNLKAGGGMPAKKPTRNAKATAAATAAPKAKAVPKAKTAQKPGAKTANTPRKSPRKSPARSKKAS